MVELKEVKTLSELRKFRDFLDVLYKDYHNYVPDLKSDEMNMLRRDKNAAFEYCDVRYFLAYKDGKIVGRVGALLNKAANERWKTKHMRITRMDFIDDPEVSAALFNAVEKWAKELGMTAVEGPMGFSDLDKEGLLIEGFEIPALSVSINNYPYYQKHYEQNGYVKKVDWLEYHLFPPAKDSEVMQKLEKLSRLVLKRQNLRVYPLRVMKDAKPLVPQMFELMNECYADLYGTVPFSKTQAIQYYKRFEPLLNPDFVKFIVDKDDKLVGFGISAPSLMEALQKNGGRLFPFGFIPVLKAIKNVKILELYLIAVKPEYQSAGLPAVLMYEVIQSCYKHGIEFAESGWELEDNERVRALWKMFETKQVRRRRCFIKEL